MFRRLAAVFALLFALTASLYAPAVRHHFIADDFINLDFVRHPPSPWATFLHPARAYSDPVTASRYKPGYVYYLALTDAALGDRAWAWHLLSLLLHAAVAAEVYLLAQRLFRDEATALGAATLFATWRLHAQMVVWMSASYRLASAALLLGAILAATGRRRRAVPLAAGLYLLAQAMNPEAIVLLPMLAGALAYLRLGPSPSPAGARRVAQVLLAVAPIGLFFLAANRVSLRSFPELPISLLPDPRRVGLFVLDLLVPFEVPRWARAAVVALVVAAAWRRRDPRLALLGGCVLVGACFAGVLRYPLAPRYLYLAAAASSIALAALLRAATARGGRSAMALVVAGLVLGNAWALRTTDLAHLGYLAQPGERLAAVQREARRSGRRATVFLQPPSTLDARNLAFFRREVRFVDDATCAEHVVPSGHDRALRRFGPALDRDYWYMPWFLDEASP